MSDQPTDGLVLEMLEHLKLVSNGFVLFLSQSETHFLRFPSLKSPVVRGDRTSTKTFPKHIRFSVWYYTMNNDFIENVLNSHWAAWGWVGCGGEWRLWLVIFSSSIGKVSVMSLPSFLNWLQHGWKLLKLLTFETSLKLAWNLLLASRPRFSCFWIQLTPQK